ncbi:putative multiple-sugar transport system permease YteP [compost metagenome]
MFILRMGNLLNVGFEKIILLYNPSTYDTADVISSFVYRKGLLEFGWSYSAAVGLFNSVINLALLITANKISKRISENSLW